MIRRLAGAHLFYGQRVLLVKKRGECAPLEYDVWSFITTPVEHHESPTEALREKIRKSVGVAPLNLTPVGVDGRENTLFLGSFSDAEFEKVMFVHTEVNGLGFFNLAEATGRGFSQPTTIAYTVHFAALDKYSRGLEVTHVDFGLAKPIMM